MTDLILKIGPWLAMIAGIVFGLFKHQQAKTATAEAGKKVAEVKATTAQSNADAALAGADATKERTNVENEIAGRPADDSAQRLRDNWSRD